MNPTLLCCALLVLLTLLTPPPARGESVVLNFHEVEIREVVEAMAKATGRNFIVDPRVKGKVSLFSKKAVAGDEAYQLFLSILMVHGYVAIPTGDVVKIVPATNARTMAEDLTQQDRAVDFGADRLETRVVDLKHVPAEELVPTLRPLVSPTGHIAEHSTSNTLVLSDFAANLDRLESIIRRIDQPSSGEVEVIPLRHASATELADVLSQLDESPEQQAQSQPKRALKKRNRGNITLVADERTNSLLLAGDKSSRIQMRALIAHLDTPVNELGNTQVIYLRFANAEEMAPILASMAENYTRHTKLTQKQQSGYTETAGEVVNVQAFTPANAVVVTAPANLLQAMEAVVRKLDIRRAQVHVEAVIAEITSDKVHELGVQWGSIPEGSGVVGGTLFNSGATGETGFSTSPFTGSDGLNLGFLNGTSTLLGTEYLNLGLLIRALGGDASTNVLSTPNLVTLDNQEAQIVVGENVPLITGKYSSGSTDASDDVNPFQTIQRQDIGITLKITPHINDGGAVRLELEQAVSNRGNTLDAADIVLNTRSIKTTVMVDDGQVLVLGGLIQDDTQLTEQKVPILGDVPILGNLFRYQKTSLKKTNLMVFLRPTILWNGPVANTISRDKYDFIRNRQIKLREMLKEKGREVSEEDAPLVPTLPTAPAAPPPGHGR